MEVIHIKNGRIISPADKNTGSIDEIKDLYIADGKILFNSPQQNPDKVIDATGMWVVPGLVDMHVHLREPGFEHKETIETGAKAAAAGGFTTIVAMPNTDPVADNCQVIQSIMDKGDALKGTKIIAAGALTIGRKGKVPVDLEEIYKVCGITVFTDDGDGVADDVLMENIFVNSSKTGAVISQHSEFTHISKKAAMHQGEVSRQLGITGQPVESEINMVRRDIELVKKTGGHLHVSHISSAGAIELVRKAKKEGLNVTAEVTPHHLHLTDEDINNYGTMAKVAPPLRTSADVKACREALKDGTIDVIATDHAPHTFDDKAGTLEDAAFGLTGLEISVPMILQLVKDGLLSPLKMIEAMSLNPSRLLGLKGGTIKSGAVADITIINPDAPYKIDPVTFFSKGRNTPFAGFIAPGRTAYTIKEGHIIFELE